MQYLEDIQANVERMVHMIDDILVIGKVEAKKIEVQPTPLNLVEFCQSLVAELRLTAPQHSIDVKTPVQSIWAQLDEQLLRSILTNILINSVRYSPPESKVQFEVFTQQNQIVFQVKDQGIGIPLEDIPHLFEPFHRGRNGVPSSNS
jgi:Osmosensitive K+ channel histidine kinase